MNTPITSTEIWNCVNIFLATNSPESDGFTGELYQKFREQLTCILGLPGGSDGKESACNVRDLSSIPGLGRSHGGGHGNPLQYSCLDNSHGKRSLAGYSPWGHKELDMTKWLSTAQQLSYSNSSRKLQRNENSQTHFTRLSSSWHKNQT